MNIELFILPIAAFHDKLYFYAQSNLSEQNIYFPSIKLSNQLHTYEAVRLVLQGCFVEQLQNTFSFEEEFMMWLNSSRCKDRIIDVYDRDRLPEQEKSVAIVRAVPVPDHFAQQDPSSWHEPKDLLGNASRLSQDCKLFLVECLNLVPMWVKNTSFTFELMNRVFSIQELRLLVSMLSNQEIDPGNFHRRLKKLDILRPLATGQQRVHRWEFAWERSVALSSDGLIP